MPREPLLTPPLEPRELNIFCQYIILVVPILVPIHNFRNPWTNYPTLALHYQAKGQLYLLHAIMAQVAFVLADTYEDHGELLSVAINYQTRAMEELRMALNRGTTDPVSLFTTIITLLFIEVPAMKIYLKVTADI